MELFWDRLKDVELLVPGIFDMDFLLILLFIGILASTVFRNNTPPLLYFYYLAVLYNAKLYFIPCCIHKQSGKSLVNHVLQ